tara:strand:- start:560 stop:841 length:282 start_codon:yes stop_codon:yes gene_type:complete
MEAAKYYLKRIYSMSKEIEMRIMDIFKKVFNDTSLVISRDTTAADVAGWNSLNNVILISEVEKEFEIKFGLSQLLNLENVGDLIDNIDSLLKE